MALNCFCLFHQQPVKNILLIYLWKYKENNLNNLRKSNCNIYINCYSTNQEKVVVLFIGGGLNPRGELDFSPLFLSSKRIFKWQVKSQI